MKWLCLSWLFATACYNPQLASPGFYCHPNDNPACPDGQKCVDGRCVGQNAPGGAGGSGGNAGSGGSGGNAGSGGSGGMSMPDLAQAPEDMTVPPDLAQPSCVPTGGDCTYHNNAICCSKYCIYASETCK